MRQETLPTYTADDTLDLSREWDEATCGSDRESLRAYLEKERPHLLRAYDADFLMQAVESTRERLHSSR
jgi:hypothetical protein